MNKWIDDHPVGAGFRYIVTWARLLSGSLERPLFPDWCWSYFWLRKQRACGGWRQVTTVLLASEGQKQPTQGRLTSPKAGEMLAIA